MQCQLSHALYIPDSAIPWQDCVQDWRKEGSRIQTPSPMMEILLEKRWVESDSRNQLKRKPLVSALVLCNKL